MCASEMFITVMHDRDKDLLVIVTDDKTHTKYLLPYSEMSVRTENVNVSSRVYILSIAQQKYTNYRISSTSNSKELNPT